MRDMGIGKVLKEKKAKLKLSAVRICAEADDLSIGTLRAVLNDEPNVREGSIQRVANAIDRLEAKSRAKNHSKVAG